MGSAEQPAVSLTATPAVKAAPAPAVEGTGDRLWPSLATGIGLLLAVAATLAPAEGVSPGSVAAPVAVPLPDWVVIAAVVSLSAASLTFLSVILPRPRKRRKKGEEDYEIYHEPRKIPPLLAIGLILLALSPVAGLGGAIVWLHGEGVSLRPAPDIIVHPAAPRTAPAIAAPTPPPEHPVRPASAIVTGLLGTIALLAGFGSLGFVLWLVFGDRWLRRLPVAGPRPRPELTAAIDDSLEELRSEPDPRSAILKIYGNFERALAGAELPRRPWQTPIEFMRAVLAKLPLPAPPVQRLTRLFEIARFSRHPVGATERDGAWQSLIEIRAAVSAQRAARDAPRP